MEPEQIDYQDMTTFMMSKEIESLRALVDLLRAALVECEHQTNSMRVWGGQSWTYHPLQAGKIAKFARAALDVPNEQK